MKLVRRMGSTLVAGSTIVALVLGGLALTSSPSLAAPQEPLCGPTIQWICTGDKDVEVLFDGTICEKASFEKSTGLTCVPYGG